MKCPLCGSTNVTKCSACSGNKYKCLKCNYLAPESRFIQ